MAYRMHTWKGNNPEKYRLLRRRDKVRRKLRDRGILPPVGSSMTMLEQEVYDQIGRDDYSFWDISKLNGGPGKLHDGGSRISCSKKIQRTKEYLLWDRVRQSSKEKEIEFSIDVDDIHIPLLCPITGVEISTDYNDNRNVNYFCLDRIDWKKGFVKDNIRVVSMLGIRQRNIQMSKDKIYDSDARNFEPTDVRKSFLMKAKLNAKNGGYSFNLTIDDIVIPKYCPYLNVELLFNKKDHHNLNYASIDRIDSKLGYVKGNIMIISRLANTMKNNATIDQLKTFSKNVLKIYNSKISKKIQKNIFPKIETKYNS